MKRNKVKILAIVAGTVFFLTHRVRINVQVTKGQNREEGQV